MARPYSHNKWSHRRLKFYPGNPQHGDDVKALQQAFNRLPPSVRGGLAKLGVDGVFGRHTLGRVRHAARALGIGLHGHGVSPYVQQRIRHPKLRLPGQKARGERYRKAHPVSPPNAVVHSNRATGGTVRERVVALALAAAHASANGERHNHYSQVGTWTVDYAVTGEPNGYRSDCSQWVTSTYHGADAPDPNGNGYNGGYTGTLGAHGSYISRNQLQPGDCVLYGPSPHHHVEEWVGDGQSSYADLARRRSPLRDRTVGHGTVPVDFGDIDMISGAHFSRSL